MEEWEALYQRQAEVLKALAHPVRLRIVRGLLEGMERTSAVWSGLRASPSRLFPNT